MLHSQEGRTFREYAPDALLLEDRLFAGLGGVGEDSRQHGEGDNNEKGK